MGLLTTFVTQLTAPYRDFKFAILKVKSMFLMPFNRWFAMKNGIASDVKQIGRQVGLKPPTKP